MPSQPEAEPCSQEFTCESDISANPFPEDEDAAADPEAIKRYLIAQREKLKKSNNGPIEDKYLGEEMLIPLLMSLSEKARQCAADKVTLAYAKAEWHKHKAAWLQKFAAPGKQAKPARLRPGVRAPRPSSRAPLQQRVPMHPGGACAVAVKQKAGTPREASEGREVIEETR
jgi:hypothetical protein